MFNILRPMIVAFIFSLSSLSQAQDSSVVLRTCYSKNKDIQVKLINNGAGKGYIETKNGDRQNLGNLNDAGNNNKLEAVAYTYEVSMTGHSDKIYDKVNQVELSCQ